MRVTSSTDRLLPVITASFTARLRATDVFTPTTPAPTAAATELVLAEVWWLYCASPAATDSFFTVRPPFVRSASARLFEWTST